MDFPIWFILEFKKSNKKSSFKKEEIKKLKRSKIMNMTRELNKLSIK